MAVTLPSVVELVCVGELGEAGAWVFGQRMEEDAVDNQGHGLRRLVRSFGRDDVVHGAEAAEVALT